MKKHTQIIDFSTVLASAVHDMKNSLCLLMQSIDNLGSAMESSNDEAKDQLAAVHYEAARLNTGLVQMLSMYRAEKDQLPINVDECYIEDLFDELQAANRNYMKQRNIELEIDLDTDLCWFLDADIVYLLLNDMMINGMRYGKTKMRLSAVEEDNYLIVTIEDDGDGYPESMLKINDASLSTFNVRQGRTGLGIYFARLIAEAHCDDERMGSIHLSNGGSLGGSVFQLKLP